MEGVVFCRGLDWFKLYGDCVTDRHRRRCKREHVLCNAYKKKILALKASRGKLSIFGGSKGKTA